MLVKQVTINEKNYAIKQITTTKILQVLRGEGDEINFKLTELLIREVVNIVKCTYFQNTDPELTNIQKIYGV